MLIKGMGDIKALEHPTLKVPYEILNKKFRVAQKNLDREVNHVQGSVGDIERILQNKPGLQEFDTVGELSRLLGGVVEKLNLLKRKADESIMEEFGAAHICKKRVDHIKQHTNTSNNSISLWKKKRLDRMLVEYFLRSGYYETAIKLARHSDIEELTNIELFLVSKDVEESLANKETAKCLTWCHDNKSKLRKMKVESWKVRISSYSNSQSSLEFNLRQQEFIELIRNDQRLEAVKHARKHFTNLEDGQLSDVQHVMGLLAFPNDTSINKYKALLDESRWQMLVQQFRQENFKLYQLSAYSVFSVALQAGLSALKTPQCYKADNERNNDCPVCTHPLNTLAGTLPYAHCSQSRLICNISGQSLNEHNHPLMLPNGYVYGEKALQTMAQENNGKVICPRTKDVFNFKDVEKVFVM